MTDLLTLFSAITIGLPVLMLALYAVGIQYQHPGLSASVQVILECVATVALLLDVALNWTLFSLYFWEWPRLGGEYTKTEYTFSDRLNRMVLQYDWRGVVSRPIARLLNFISPDGRHIPNAARLDFPNIDLSNPK